jgi:hypothetical protein
VVQSRPVTAVAKAEPELPKGASAISLVMGKFGAAGS